MARDLRLLPGDVDRFLDVLHKEAMITTQSRLGSSRVSPVDSGRLKASWFATPDRDNSKETQPGLESYTPSDDAKQLPLDYKRRYYLSNNVEYAEPVTGGKTKLKSKDKKWFISFLATTWPKICDAAARVAASEATKR